MPKPAHSPSKSSPETIATRFAASFSDYAARAEYTAILRPVEEELSTIGFAASMGRPFDCRDLLTTAARGFVKQSAATTVRNIICGIAAHCESAIELSFALALGMVARAKEYAVLYDFGGWRVFGDPDGDINVRIQPQVVLYGCRVDFLVSMTAVHLDDQQNVQVGSMHAVVECDGHDFHDRTKEQASKDRERDRNLQLHGLTVLRFTGADIWRDVFASAEESLHHLRTRMETAQLSIPKRPSGSASAAGIAEVL